MAPTVFFVRRIIPSIALILASFVVWSSLLDGLFDWSRLDFLELLEPVFPKFFSEPIIAEITNLSIFFVFSVLFWHLTVFFLPSVTRLYERQSIITEAKIVSSIDYVWILAAAFAAIFSVSALTVRASNEELSRLKAQEELQINVAQEAFLKATALCQENPVLVSYSYSTKDRITAVYYPEMCSYVDSRRNIVDLSYQFDFLHLCSDAGFEPKGGEGGFGPIAEPERVPEKDRKSIEAVSLACIYAWHVRDVRMDRQKVEEKVASFDEGILTQSSLWFLIVLFLAALRLTKTTRDVFR